MTCSAISSILSIIVINYEFLYLNPLKVLIIHIANFDLLFIDEWVLNVITDEDLNFIFELIERRHVAHSTIYCTQFRKEDCHQRLGGGLHADAMLDRIVHKSVWFETG